MEEYIKYSELLSQREWFAKCNRILNRDHFMCRDCGCIGFHNGGNFIELESISEVDEILGNFMFYEKPFSEFYKWLPKPNYTDKHIKDIEFGDCDKEFDDLVYSHFFKPSYIDIADIDSFPIVFKSFSRPSRIIQRDWHWGIKIKNKEERIGELFEFFFPDSQLHSICVCIEESDYVDHITIQVENRILALVIARNKHLFKGLNIHHKYYITGRKPWDYDDDALITLCEDCHQKRHQSSVVYLFNDIREPQAICKICDKCAGRGYLPQYCHIEHGICFKCGGEGVLIKNFL